MGTAELLMEVKRRVLSVAPSAEVILYGSYARGEQGPDSDIDLLILVDGEHVDQALDTGIAHPLYHLEYATGTVISPRVVTRKAWYGRPLKTPFYLEVERDGVKL